MLTHARADRHAPIPGETSGLHTGGNTLLAVRELCVSFGGIQALRDVTFCVGRNEFVGLIGPNGAGKTTVMNAFSRFTACTTGQILLNDENLLELKAHQVAARGVSRTFQNLALCPSLSVIDNVMLGGALRDRPSIMSRWMLTGTARRHAARLRDRAWTSLKEMGFEHHAKTPVGALSYGDKRTVELARSLCSRPQLLLLDEPASGLNEVETGRLVETLSSIRARAGLAVIVIEHHIDVVMELCDRIVVLNLGSVIADGLPDVIRQTPAVVEAYLGAPA